jgi:hypothetical protein
MAAATGRCRGHACRAQARSYNNRSFKVLRGFVVPAVGRL